MTRTNRRRWSGRLALAALLAGTTLLAGCYHPHYRHHGRHGGWYGYDHDRDHRRHRRHDRHERRHDRHHDRHDCDRRGDHCRH